MRETERELNLPYHWPNPGSKNSPGLQHGCRSPNTWPIFFYFPGCTSWSWSTSGADGIWICALIRDCYCCLLCHRTGSIKFLISCVQETYEMYSWFQKMNDHLSGDNCKEIKALPPKHPLSALTIYGLNHPWTADRPVCVNYCQALMSLPGKLLCLFRSAKS